MRATHLPSAYTRRWSVYYKAYAPKALGPKIEGNPDLLYNMRALYYI